MIVRAKEDEMNREDVDVTRKVQHVNDRRHHTLEVQARILTDTKESIVALTLRDNARGLDIEPLTVHLSLAEAVRFAEMVWGVVGDIRRADANGRTK